MGDQEAEEIPLGSATMQSDYRHKPQQVMCKVIMDIQEYDYVVEYLPGKTNIADYLSLLYRADEIKHDLHVVDVVIYHGKRLIVPESLQQRVIELGNESHQGTSKTKTFIR